MTTTDPAAGEGRKFRKKPVVIEALTFDELVAYGLANGANVVNGMPWSFKFRGHPITHENDDCYLIPTLEGTMKMTRTDVLIVGVKGEIYPCRADIFAATYEPAEPPAPQTAGEEVNDLDKWRAHMAQMGAVYVDPKALIGDPPPTGWAGACPKPSGEQAEARRVEERLLKRAMGAEATATKLAEMIDQNKWNRPLDHACPYCVPAHTIPKRHAGFVCAYHIAKAYGTVNADDGSAALAAGGEGKG